MQRQYQEHKQNQILNKQHVFSNVGNQDVSSEHKASSQQKFVSSPEGARYHDMKSHRPGEENPLNHSHSAQSANIAPHQLYESKDRNQRENAGNARENADETTDLFNILVKMNFQEFLEQQLSSESLPQNVCPYTGVNPHTAIFQQTAVSQSAAVNQQTAVGQPTAVNQHAAVSQPAVLVAASHFRQSSHEAEAVLLHSQMVHTQQATNQADQKIPAKFPHQQQQNLQMTNDICHAGEGINQPLRTIIALILHACMCQRAGVNRVCNVQWCKNTKNLLSHMTYCRARPEGRTCFQLSCVIAKEVLTHWKTCISDQCNLCEPLIQEIRRTCSASNDLVTHWKTCVILTCQMCATLNGILVK